MRLSGVMDHITAKRRLRFSSLLVHSRRVIWIAYEVVDVLIWRPVAQLVRARP